MNALVCGGVSLVSSVGKVVLIAIQIFDTSPTSEVNEVGRANPSLAANRENAGTTGLIALDAGGAVMFGQPLLTCQSPPGDVSLE